MPNGRPHWDEERPKVEEFFGKISNVLEDFAKTHNLSLTKYARQWPAWCFIFRHPEAGIGRIEVEKAGKRSVIIRPSWCIVDFENSTFWVKEPKTVKCSLDHEALSRVLEDTLKQIVSWNKEDLKAIKSQYHDFGTHCNRAEFERAQQEYPFPKIE